LLLIGSVFYQFMVYKDYYWAYSVCSKTAELYLSLICILHHILVIFFRHIML